MATQYLAEIRMFAGNFAPVGWALCNGQLLSIAQNDALYALLGTTYGGDGVNTFALPDLRGRVPVHFGQGSGLSNYNQGQQYGVEQVTLNTNQIPAHNHLVNCNSAGTNQSALATKTTPAGNFPGTESSGAGIYESAANATMNPLALSPSGGSQPHENHQPYLGINFIIALQGVFPTQN